MTKVDEHQVPAAEKTTVAQKHWQAPVLRTYSIDDSTQTFVAGSVSDGVPGFFNAS